MTGHEASQVLALVAVAWPHHKLPRETSALYCRMIADLGFEETVLAVKSLVASCKFPPTIAEIRSEVIENRADLPDPQQAWMLVCLRWGPGRGRGDRSVELGPLITAALDAAGVNLHAFHTTENRHWLKQAFLDIYTVMRKDAIKWEDLGSRYLDRAEVLDGNARMGTDLGVHASEAERLPAAADAGRRQHDQRR